MKCVLILIGFCSTSVFATFGCGNGQTTDDEFENDLVFLFGSNTAGQKYLIDLDDPAGLCPDGASYLGRFSSGSMCLIRDAGVIAAFLGDRSPLEAPREGLDDCPEGWRFLGGTTENRSVCQYDRAATTTTLQFSRHGEEYEEETNSDSFCPPQWEVAGQSRPSVVCITVDPVEVLVVGADAPDQDLCFDSFEFLGSTNAFAGIGIPVSICGRTGPGTLIMMYSEETQECPHELQWIGETNDRFYCGSPNRIPVVQIRIDVHGRELADVDSPDELCPNGWQLLEVVGNWVQCGRL